jgi:type III pantothenate kinase
VIALDLGTTRLKWGRWDGGRLTALGDAPAESAPPEALLELLDKEGGVGVDVRPTSAEQTFDAACRGAGCAPPLWLHTPASACGVRVGYTDPGRFGADRFAALVAARARAEGACLVVDAGSALTLDVMDGDGQHRGGLIFPGLTALRGALARTSPRLEAFVDADTRCATDTATAVGSGTARGLAAAVAGLAADMLGSARADARLWMTGGDAARLLPLLGEPWVHQPHLVLEGVARWGEAS